MTTILIITGGTGGHIFPALAVGDALRTAGANPMFITRRDTKDTNLIGHFNFPYFTVPASGFFGKGIKEIFIFFANFITTLILFPKILFRTKPAALVCSGGFSSIVPTLWALILNKNFFLLEQNCIPGRFTRYFSRWAREIYLGFPLKYKIRGNTIFTGNPLRKEILSNDRQDDGKTVLVLGGSQGAKFINLNAVELAARMPELHFIVQTGRRDYETIKQLVKSSNCELIDFTLKPEELYKKATIVISRAGAMVLSELLLFGIPSIIIPFPFATDNHQAANAQFLAQKQAAVIISQGRQPGYSEDFVNKLKTMIKLLIQDQARLTEMSRHAQAIAKRDASATIARRIIKCLAK